METCVWKLEIDMHLLNYFANEYDEKKLSTEDNFCFIVLLKSFVSSR